MRGWTIIGLVLALACACGDQGGGEKDGEGEQGGSGQPARPETGPKPGGGEKPKPKPPTPEPDAGQPTTIPSGMAGVPDIRILKVRKTGSGDKCGTGKTASVRYKAMLADGKVVDPGSRPFTFPVGQRRAIVGWDRVVAEMRVGDSWTVHIPYQLCYGEAGRPGIPPRADMKFDMELLSFR